MSLCLLQVSSRSRHWRVYLPLPSVSVTWVSQSRPRGRCPLNHQRLIISAIKRKRQMLPETKRVSSWGRDLGRVGSQEGRSYDCDGWSVDVGTGSVRSMSGYRGESWSVRLGRVGTRRGRRVGRWRRRTVPKLGIIRKTWSLGRSHRRRSHTRLVHGTWL